MATVKMITAPENKISVNGYYDKVVDGGWVTFEPEAAIEIRRDPHLPKEVPTVIIHEGNEKIDLVRRLKLYEHAFIGLALWCTALTAVAVILFLRG